MSSLARKKRNFIIAVLIILTVLLVRFVMFPVVDLFKMSFISWNGISPSSDFIWLNNYKSMFHNVDLWQSLRNNAMYFVVHLCMVPVELVFAVLLTSRLRAAEFCKTMVFMPYIINGVAIFYVFSYFFSPVNGTSDTILEALHMGVLSDKGWLSVPEIVNFVPSFVSLWQFSGYRMILFMVALQSLPWDIQEVARIDGTSAWQMFKFVQAPATMLMVDFILFDNIEGFLQVSDVPFIMTSDGLDYASSTFALYTVETVFSYSNFGLASTMAAAIMVMVLVIYLVQNKIIHGIMLKGGK